MIHNFCYSHLIMINTLCTCTVHCVQYKYEYSTEYTVHCTVQSVSLFFCSAQFYLGGGACTLYSTECIVIFCSAQFYLGGLKPPQALMTRRPCLQYSIIRNTVLLGHNCITVANGTVSLLSTVIQLYPAVQFQIIELNMGDYTPTHGTTNLTSDSCSAYEETYSYLVL